MSASPSESPAPEPSGMDSQHAGIMGDLAEDDFEPAEDDDEFDKVVQRMNEPNANMDFLTRDLEIGEKADDAIDYEDFDDDELPDEEVVAPSARPPTAIPQDDDLGDLFGGEEGFQGGQEGEGDELDDLFGDVPSSPAQKQAGIGLSLPITDHSMEAAFGESGISQRSLEVHDDIFAEDIENEKEAPPSPTLDMDPATLRDYQLQQALFAMSAYGPDNPPAPPENNEELLASLWPKFDKDALPRFMELIPPKKARFIGKAPIKPPKRINPTKINIELAPDQERAFLFTGQTQKKPVESDQFITVMTPPSMSAESSDVEGGDDSDEELPGGITMEDLQFICADWDVKSPTPENDTVATPEVPQNDEDDWLFEVAQPTKKRKLGRDPADYLSYSHIDLPNLDDPAEATALLARKIRIDMNDPHLLLDDYSNNEPITKIKSSKLQSTNEISSGLTKRLMQRYNISNDAAYDMLKENHQNKVRSTLGNIALEHSLPAIRLQWPYYKTKLARPEARSFHRPSLTFHPNLPLTFKVPAYLKRKHQKGKDAKTLFDTTKSLSLADNSNALLIEHSEEYPTMLSNFGMGSRLINYYRKKNAEDPSRPKTEIGETAVLLPQDKSPFSSFGHVDPGETTPTITTGLYRAPVFRQEVKSTDFLIVRNSTGVEGSSYFIRNIDHLYVAGQQFPSIDVPGPHSRKVTTAAKNRLKMICYRRIKRNGNNRVSVAEVTEHFPDSTDMQNRQKMKEFLQFNKDHKEWEMKSGESVPSEDVMRGYVKPEDVCLLEAMQVGQQQLHDAGYDRESDNGDDYEGKEGESLEQQLAPWKTTRSFLLASQGKAMLQLHGEGDPTGRGEGFSFIKTSMKGGFRAVGESVEDKIDAQRQKELGGHSYNVARQQKSYEEAIRRIWESQKSSLSSTVHHSDEESDVDMGEADELFGKPTPRSDRPTPSFSRRDDETTSQFSRFSTSSQSGKVMVISRQLRNNKGQIETVKEVIRDARVIKQYQKQRHEADLANMTLVDIQPTGNPEVDARNMKHIEDELRRLQRNKERRHAREKQKSVMAESNREMSPNTAAGSPAASGSGGPKTGGTQRKCANCGQVGHIKTNKKCVARSS
ncbi:TPA_exp: Uncharacterized protein A8136_2628 [Trichophyton benhamiae CBS 112371]|uniref:Transcription initiation factor TFIID subunit 1 histone acetyltransferase domain-containing protein n=1 Tax=Arthroderma benhamiae (strain ATCC MYA-4681 / CBS 112371) TaxID=663331 RepID=D4AKW7_ARTBC|nr:uncharacterized protein ARB_04963 [Trichophyton benhamiae CBS 112371]EFE36026.1 hypothetical protein ARB_04963 [Trichophyton benhamiae CBS 112371]DAA78843.1 TPA_exp: Uncharacterized protein A8136_2628 [Trichophyton benhamiae CBS 112371]